MRVKESMIWDKMFELVKEYQNKYGDFRKSMIIKFRGKYVGVWLLEQITNYSELGKECIDKLDSIGFSWNEEDLYDYETSKFDEIWNANFNLLKKYKDENNHTLLSCSEVYENVNLGSWLYRQRVSFQQGRLSKERVVLLESIGVFLGSWEEDGWNYKYSYAKQYYKKNKTLSVPTGYVIGGFNLYSWLHFQKQKKVSNELSEERIKLLEDIGMKWSKSYQDKWLDNFEIAKQYYEEKGSLSTIRNEQYHGINLDAWLNNQRRAKRGEKHRKISQEQIDLLDTLNMNW